MKIIVNCLVLLMMVSTVEATSLWSGSAGMGGSYFTTQPVPERQINDIVFILIDESTIASLKAENETEKETTVNGDVSAWLKLADIRNLFSALIGRDKDLSAKTDKKDSLPEWTVEIENEFTAEGETSRTHTIRAKIAGRIVDIKPNGNMVLTARRSVQINNETVTLQMTGIARPNDVDGRNEIESSKIAELKFSVEGEGGINRAVTPGLFTRILGFLT